MANINIEISEVVAITETSKILITPLFVLKNTALRIIRPIYKLFRI